MKRSGRTFRRRKRRLHQAMNFYEGIKDHPKEKELNFTKWLCKKGFKHAFKMRLHNFEGIGRGIIALKNMHPGTIFISIPEHLLITPDYIFETNIGLQLKRCDQEVSDLEILTLFLMLEKIKGCSSEWYPYIKVLPVEYDVPVYFRDSFWNQLPVSMCVAYKNKLKDVHSSYVRILTLMRDIGISAIDHKKDFYFELFIWAYFTVNTRSVYKQCGHKYCRNIHCTFTLALAPYLDFLNHSWKAKVIAGFNPDNKCYEIMSQDYCKKYSQIFINYGSHSNRKLLLEYGFIQEGNINDLIPVSLSDICSVFENTFQETLLPETMQFLMENVNHNIGITQDGMTWSLEIALKLLCQKDKTHWKDVLLGLSTTCDTVRYQKLVSELIYYKLKEYNDVELSPVMWSSYSSAATICQRYWKSICKLLSMERDMLLEVLALTSGGEVT